MNDELLNKPVIKFLIDSGAIVDDLKDNPSYYIQKLGKIVSEEAEPNGDEYFINYVVKIRDKYVASYKICNADEYDHIENILNHIHFVEPYEATVTKYRKIT